MTALVITADGVVPVDADPIDVTEIIAESGAEVFTNDWLVCNDAAKYSNVERIIIKGEYPGVSSAHYARFPTADWYIAVEPNAGFWEAYDAKLLFPKMYDYSFKKYETP